MGQKEKQLDWTAHTDISNWLLLNRHHIGFWMNRIWSDVYSVSSTCCPIASWPMQSILYIRFQDGRKYFLVIFFYHHSLYTSYVLVRVYTRTSTRIQMPNDVHINGLYEHKIEFWTCSFVRISNSFSIIDKLIWYSFVSDVKANNKCNWNSVTSAMVCRRWIICLHKNAPFSALLFCEWQRWGTNDNDNK